MDMQQSDVKYLDATVGVPLTVTLWEDRTRGEQWVPVYDVCHFALTEDDFVCTTSNNAVESGSRQFEFEPCLSGTHRLEFHKRMAWKFTFEARRVFLIHVRERGS